MTKFDLKNWLILPVLDDLPKAQRTINPLLSSPPSRLEKTPAPPVASLVTPMLKLKNQILVELEANLGKLMTLNPSRREAALRYLQLLSGSGASAPARGRVARDHDPLKQWLENHRSPAQNRALATFLEEVALIALAQALLLKAWSDRGQRPWKQTDLTNLNWALCTALKPQIPLDRDGWQITRPNLYSWYAPCAKTQEAIWELFNGWRIAEEGSGFLPSLLQSLRHTQPEACLPGYDARFFEALWNTMHDSSPASSLLPAQFPGRSRVAFSPSLRDGTMARTGPSSIQWIALESSPFQMFIAELVQLWWGPTTPPVWAVGTGLEVHARDQMTFALSSPKPSLLSRITEMEACEVAFVLEERCVRPQARGTASLASGCEIKLLEEALDLLPYFKKLRSAGTTLGDLQACVALSKLRPGGLLWWAREEPLSSHDGEGCLAFLLERAQIVCEWDFAELKHQLPATLALFPKHLYLLKRENRTEERLNHRPLRIATSGQVRSHVEIPLVLQDAFASVHEGAPRSPSRGQWQIQAHRSPLAQREWAARWPDPASQNAMLKLEKFEAASLRLAGFTTVRAIPDSGDWSMHSALHGFWIKAGERDGKRILETHPLPRKDSTRLSSSPIGGFLILVADERWVTPLRAYLETEPVRTWLEHHAEQKGGKWNFQEQIVKWIPVSQSLLKAMQVPQASPSEPIAVGPMPADWERIAGDLVRNPGSAPKAALDRFQALDPRNAEDAAILAAIFVRAARALETARTGEGRLNRVVSDDGVIRWKDLLEILPKSECIGVPYHPRVAISGNLPPHSPVIRIERVRTPTAGILLATENGFSLHLGSDQSMILDMLWAQLEGLTHPTWNELVGEVRLPRRIELAKDAAEDMLRSHGEQRARIASLQATLDTCPLF